MRKPLILFFCASFVIFGIHQVLYNIPAIQTQLSQRSIIEIHTIIGSLTLLILFSLFQVKRFASQQVGMAFLASGLVKMIFVGSYFFFKFNTTEIEHPKTFTLHFFAIYFFYLALETYLTFRFFIKKD